MKSTLPPDAYENAATKVLSKVSLRINQKIEWWDFALGSEIVERLVEFFRNHRDELGDHQFGFELQQTTLGSGKTLTPKSIVALNADEPKLVTLDKDFRIIKSKPLALDPSEAAEMVFSEESADTVIAQYESKTVVNFYANGFTCGRVSLDSPASPPPVSGKFVRRAEDYELAIRDHYRERVKYWQIDHWDDRKKRVLRKHLGVSKITEDIFHRSLVRWLDLNLQAIVSSKPLTVDSDQPDIFVSAYGGKFFVVEVKWLGTNGTTPYGIPRLIQGIGQLRTYLTKQTTVTKGHSSGL